MPFALLQAQALPPDHVGPEAWALVVDGAEATFSTMELDHRRDPLVVDHHCDPATRCSLQRVVSARRVAGAVAWLPPPAEAVADEDGPGSLALLARGPRWFEAGAYGAAVLALLAAPEAGPDALPGPSRRETGALLWHAAEGALGANPAWPTAAAWEPPWAALLAERTFAAAEPGDHPWGPALEDAAGRLGSATLVEVRPERPAASCALWEGFLGRAGEPVVVRLVAADQGGAPGLWHPVGSGCWGRLIW